MLYNLLVPLSADFGPLNVFRYITFRASLAMAFALILTIAVGPGSSLCCTGSSSASTSMKTFSHT